MDRYGDTMIKKRLMGFLIWQSIQSATIYTLSKLFFFSPFSPSPNKFTPSLITPFLFVPFLLSHLLFSLSLSLISCPQQLDRPAYPLELLMGLVRVVFVAGGEGMTVELRRRVRVLVGFAQFVGVAAVSGFVGVGCVCWGCGWFCTGFWEFGFRGFVAGLVYGVGFVYQKRWILRFPIIQRPPFFSFKMGIPSAFTQALKFSCAGYILSAVLAVFLQMEYKSEVTMGKFIAEQMIIYNGIFVVFLCWELSHHLHQVLHTKRFMFAPPKGSAAAETNPTEPLLAALEESKSKSVLQYLAYLDLCMVCESNADSWRRAAFFEESGETYKRVLAVCLRPLEQFTLKLGEGFESCSNEAFQVSHQLTLPTEQVAESILQQAFDDIQLCTWCAQIVSSLTVRSRKEDRFGVAQLSGSNAAVISTLLSCLLAVETCMGKKTNLQSPNYLMSTGAIKWATVNSGRKNPSAGPLRKRKGNPVYSKAYSMADILRTSIYSIVSTFHKEMVDSSKAGLTEKDWIITSKPLYGSRELLLQKLSLFLDFRAS